MAIIKTHGTTLHGSAGGYEITLRPLCDAHLPYLYKWNADPEVLYWSEGDDVQQYDAETVRDIYGPVSQAAFSFLVEANGTPIGECWLQKMNMQAVLDMYPAGTDIRRIDMMLGEKEYWNRGIGTALVGMLVDFAFTGEGVDVLHVFVYDYNERSRKVFEKNGFRLILREPSTQAPDKAKEDLHLRITKEEYMERKLLSRPPGDDA